MDGQQPVAQMQPPPPGASGTMPMMMGRGGPMMMGHHGISGMPMRPPFGRDWARPPPPPPPRSKDGGREAGRRGRDKVDILDMTYEEYLESFEKIKGGDDRDQQQSQGPGNELQANVQMMTEEQYIEYCKKYTEQMGMPFDEGMVRNHYQQMKSQFTQQ